MQVLSNPAEVTLELTNACNLDCVFCYADSGRAYANELTTEEWKAVIAELAEMGVFIVFFGGGEPLLRQDFFELADYAAQRDLSVAVSTNGTLITPQIAQKLANSRVGPVQISLDGGTAATHDPLRGKKGAFKKTIEGMAILKDAGVAYQISTTVTKQNFGELKRLYELTVSCGANALFFANVLPARKTSTDFHTLTISREQELQLVAWVRDWRKNSAIYVTYIGSCATAELVEQKSLNETDKAFLKCEAGRIRCVVDPVGNVFPCELVRFPFLIAGNVRHKRFRDIWAEDSNFSLFRLAESTRTCSVCDFADLSIKLAG
jgi:mycofactocin radical SAM maturase